MTMAVAVMMFASLATGCSHEKNELAHDHSQDTAEAQHPGHDGEITLDSVQVATLGIATETVSPADFASVIEVAGQITGAPSDQATVSARTAGIVNLAPGISAGSNVAAGQRIASVSARGMQPDYDSRSASVALEAAKRELDRITPLAQEGIVTRRDYNAAKQRYEEARAAAAGASRATSSVAASPARGTITQLLVANGQYVEAGQPLALISGNSSLSLRADVPQHYAAFVKSVSGASFRPSYASEAIDISQFGGHLTASPATVAEGGYIPVYFTLRNDGSLVSGTYCTVYLRGAARQGVIALPVEAVTEQQGKNFVYLLEHKGAYRKQPVTLGQSDGTMVEIISGLKPGDNVVTKGATFVRLAESADVVPEGHKH